MTTQDTLRSVLSALVRGREYAEDINKLVKLVVGSPVPDVTTSDMKAMDHAITSLQALIDKGTADAHVNQSCTKNSDSGYTSAEDRLLVALKESDGIIRFMRHRDARWHDDEVVTRVLQKNQEAIEQAERGKGNGDA